jgi:small subunit ribosomal protein S11e
VPVHLSPCFRVKEGDKVVVGQCRPLSKTVRFNVLKVIPMGSKLGVSSSKGKGFAAF